MDQPALSFNMMATQSWRICTKKSTTVLQKDEKLPTKYFTMSIRQTEIACLPKGLADSSRTTAEFFSDSIEFPTARTSKPMSGIAIKANRKLIVNS